jgi:hypothetical protein
VVLINFIDGSIPDEKLEAAVARNAADDAYFICRDSVLICVPDSIVFKSVRVEDVPLPRLATYLEEHLEEVEGYDFELWERYGFPTLH